MGGRLDIEPDAPLPPLAVLMRLLVPGWAQIYSGRTMLGQWMLGIYLVFLVFTILSFGSAFSTFCLAGIFTTHASSVYDIAHYSTSRRGGRLSRCLVGVAVLGIGLYYPLMSGLEIVASPILLNANRGSLRRGDVLLTRRLNGLFREARPGDIVVYDIPEGLAPGPAGAHIVYVVRGQRIDRVLAVAGQFVEWRDGILTIDGQKSDLMPLGAETFREQIRMKVPSDSYLILPSTEQFQGNGVIPSEQWHRWSAVPKANVSARVYWRNWPLSRFGPLR